MFAIDDLPPQVSPDSVASVGPAVNEEFEHSGSIFSIISTNSHRCPVETNGSAALIAEGRAVLLAPFDYS